MPDLPKPQIAQLSTQQLKRIESLEQCLGDVYVVAYEQPVAPAKLTPEQLATLQQAEKELGKCLIAYKSS